MDVRSLRERKIRFITVIKMSVFGSIGKWFSSDRPPAPGSLMAMDQRVDDAIFIEKTIDNFLELPMHVQGPFAAFLQDTVNAKPGQEPTLAQSKGLQRALNRSSEGALFVFKFVTDQITKLASLERGTPMDQMREFVNEGPIAEVALLYKNRPVITPKAQPAAQLQIEAPRPPAGLLAAPASALLHAALA
jgi:hypothetical protein